MPVEVMNVEGGPVPVVEMNVEGGAVPVVEMNVEGGAVPVVLKLTVPVAVSPSLAMSLRKSGRHRRFTKGPTGTGSLNGAPPKGGNAPCLPTRLWRFTGSSL